MTAIIRRLITGTIVPETIRAVEGGTAGRVANFKLSKIYENPDPNFKKLSYQVQSPKFHGSTEKRTSDQMNSGAFEDRNKKVYFAELETAIDYATGRTAPNDTAVVHEIYSQQKPSTNSISTDGWGFGLGLYSFFKTATNRVHIVRSWKVEKIAP